MNSARKPLWSLAAAAEEEPVAWVAELDEASEEAEPEEPEEPRACASIAYRVSALAESPTANFR